MLIILKENFWERMKSLYMFYVYLREDWNHIYIKRGETPTIILLMTKEQTIVNYNLFWNGFGFKKFNLPKMFIM